MKQRLLAIAALTLASVGCNGSPSAPTSPAADAPSTPAAAPPAAVAPAGPQTPTVAAAPDVGFDKAKSEPGYADVKKLGKSPLPQNADTWKKGQAVFSNCATCHGPGGKGDGPAGMALDPKPRDFTDVSAYKYGYGDLGIFRTGKYGSEGTGMAGWNGRLKDDDLWAVVYYIRTLQVKK